MLTARGQDVLRRAWPVYREAIHRHLGQAAAAAAAAAQIVTVASGQPQQRSY